MDREGVAVDVYVSTDYKSQAPMTLNHHRQSQLTFQQFEALCDDPQRDLTPTPRNVRAILLLQQTEGFFLWAEDGDELHQVVDADHRPVRFRTIEIALRTLQRVSGLGPEIGVRLLPP